ncbi:MAG: ATPase, partial [Bacteroidales bacterium]|nr:ATPase [Bacteroidales bacterium]
PVIKPQDIIHAREVVKEVYIDSKIENYITDIVFATRFPEEYGMNNLKSFISYGASPRATINLALASRALAFIKRRGYVIPEDVREVCLDVLRHRIGLTYEAEAENIKSEDIATEIVNKIDVP